MADDPNQPPDPVPSTPSDSSNPPPTPELPEQPESPLPAETSAEEGQPPISPEPSQTPQPESLPISETPPPVPETPPQSPPSPELPQSPLPEPQIIEKEVIREVPVEVIKEVIKEVPVEVVREVIKEVPVEKEVIREVIREVPKQVEDPEFNRRVEEKLQQRLKEEGSLRRKKAMEARVKKKEDNLARLLQYTQQKGSITSPEASSYLQISKSTSTKYLKELVRRGQLKPQKVGKITKYSI